MTAGGSDGWGWRDLETLPVSWYGGLADIFAFSGGRGALASGAA